MCIVSIGGLMNSAIRYCENLNYMNDSELFIRKEEIFCFAVINKFYHVTTFCFEIT
jgi:hypothetical protein